MPVKIESEKDLEFIEKIIKKTKLETITTEFIILSSIDKENDK
jgi:hypothetical protein